MRITLGSDAHWVQVLAGGLDVLRDMLWLHGYREIATFDRGRQITRPLQPPVAAPAAKVAGDT